MNIQQIGLRILGLRKECGLLQHELAEKLGLDRATLSRIENGKNAPTANILIKLRQFFSISLDWLICGSGPREQFDSDKEINNLLIDMKKCTFLKHHILGIYYQFRYENPQLLGIKKKNIQKGEGEENRENED